MSAAFIQFHAQDNRGVPIAGALLSAASTFGPWQATTNACGDFFTPPPGLAPGHYDVTVSAPGFTTRRIPMDLGDCGQVLIGLEPSSSPVGPFEPAPREYRGNMCGVHVQGLESPVDVGQADLSLVLSWFIDRYIFADRQRIYARYHELGIKDVLTSWPDSQNFGFTPTQFRAFQLELIANGFRPAAMLSAKPTSSADVRDLAGTLANILLVLPSLVGIVPRFCTGWELSLWLSPSDVQWLNEQLGPICHQQADTKLYNHFQEGYMSFPEPNTDNASFWNKQVGLLEGVFFEVRQGVPDSQMLDLINDCLERFAGNDNMPIDNGTGTPFAFIVLEISAMKQFANTCTEAEGNRLGQLAVNAPARSGPAGIVGTSGSGNGQQ